MPKIAQTYCFPARLSKAGHQRLGVLLEQHRQLYNAALQERRGAYQWDRYCKALESQGLTPYQGVARNVSFNRQANELTGIRSDDPEWDSIAVRLTKDTVLKRLDDAYKRFYRNLRAGIPVSKAGKPRFRPAHRFRTLEVRSKSENYLREDRTGRFRLQIKGCPAIRFRPHRPMPEGQPETVRIVRKARRVEVQLVYMVSAPEPTEPSGRGIGLDVGVKWLVSDSQGQQIAGRRIDRRREKRLSRRMASIREKAKKSGRYHYNPGRRRYEWADGPTLRYKAVQRQHERESERQGERHRNGLHRISASIIARCEPGDTIGVEDLRIQNMLKNHHLARAISEQGWGELLRQLQYKAERAGLHYRLVDPRNTSQACSGCGEVVPKKLKDREHNCPHCGVMLDRDVNASINVLLRAVFSGAAGVNSGRKASSGGGQDIYQPPELSGVAAEIRPERRPGKPVQLGLFPC